MQAWALCWGMLGRLSPKPMNGWRLFLLRCFGAHIDGSPFVHPRARIHIPWNVTLGDGSCIGDGATLYSLTSIEIQDGATVAQESYLCTGTHDLRDPNYPLQVAPIVVERDAFIFARAFVMPGITIGRGAVVGACSVVTKDVLPNTTVMGSPARPRSSFSRSRPE